MEDDEGRIEQLLRRWSEGDQGAEEELFALVYDELCSIAARYLHHEPQAHGRDPRALVHEAYLRLIGQNRVRWTNRAHFYGVTALLMQRILVDQARHDAYQKRGGDIEVVPLDEIPVGSAERSPALSELDEALSTLAVSHREQRQIVELRFFAGLSHAEIAEVTGLSVATVNRRWRQARTWLYEALTS